MIRDGLPTIVHGSGPLEVFYYEDFLRLPSMSTTTGAADFKLFETDLTATELLDTTVAGGVLKLTQAANDNDVISLIGNSGIRVDQLHALEAVYFGCKFKVTDADDCDVHIGMGLYDESYTASAPDDMWVAQIAEGSANINLIVRKDAASTTESAAGVAADNTWVRLFMSYIPTTTVDTGTVYYEIHSNGRRYADSFETAGNFPDDVVIFPVIQFQNGDTAADTMSIDWIYYGGLRADFVDGTG